MEFALPVGLPGDNYVLPTLTDVLTLISVIHLLSFSEEYFGTP